MFSQIRIDAETNVSAQQENMPRVTPNHSMNGDNEFTVKLNDTIKKDPTGVAIRNEILKSPPFNYSDEDIKLYSKFCGKNDFDWVQSRQTGELLTKEEREKLKIGEPYSVSLDQATVSGIKNFKEIRNEIDNGLSSIDDPKLKDWVRNRLLGMSVGNESSAIDNQMRLTAYLASDNGYDDKTLAIIRDTIKKVAAHKANADNPATSLAAVQMEIRDTPGTAGGPLGPPNAEVIQRLKERILTICKQSGGIDLRTGSATDASRPVDAKAAEMINKQAAEALRKLGDEQGALQREAIARLWGATDAERLSKSPFIETKKPNEPPSMGAPSPRTPEEKRLKQIDTELNRSTPPNPGKLSDVKTTTTDPTMYYPNAPRDGTVKAAGSMLALGKTVLDFMAADHKMNLIAEKYQLIDKINRSKYMEKPMTVIEAKTLKENLKRDFEAEKDPETRKRLSVAVQWATLMQEASQAFYAPRKEVTETGPVKTQK